jgi:hypothetical protein
LNQTAAADELAACTHAVRAVDGQVGGEVELDTVPSNTVSNTYIGNHSNTLPVLT